MERDQIISRIWDVIVVGTGIGGATLGYALAKAGKSVLFCEKGPSHLGHDGHFLEDDWAESYFFREGGTVPLDSYLRRAGRSYERIRDMSDGSGKAFTPTLGTGTGGSSALYGMALERFFPGDFTPRRFFADAPEANLPDAWPIALEDIAPYYTKAEELYRVRATPDPLRPVGEERGIRVPPPFSAGNAELVERFRAKGLNPYYLPMACDYKPGCKECIGFICKLRCKGDSANICVEPAVRDHGAILIDKCDVESLEAGASRVEAVHCRWNGEPVTLRARTVVLGAGAIHTAAILLRSGGVDRPEGLANRSGEVGRNLMRHFLDYYIVYPKTRPAPDALVKQIALNDLYFTSGAKYGTLQSNGRLPPVRNLAMGLREDLRKKSSLLGAAFPALLPFVEFGFRRMLSGSLVLASIMEDLPYRDNRIGLAPDGKAITFNYRIHPYDRARIAQFRGKIAELLAPHRFHMLKLAERNRALGHMCGTCRFGVDPTTSVLDRNNRAHDLDNLYVVDSSFFPSSAGTNPSLTIAANALRVAEKIAASST
ncbi:MAG TPA: GMC family oxidoreductase [Rhizomicrobium sp.]